MSITSISSGRLERALERFSRLAEVYPRMSPLRFQRGNGGSCNRAGPKRGRSQSRCNVASARTRGTQLITRCGQKPYTTENAKPAAQVQMGACPARGGGCRGFPRERAQSHSCQCRG
eukprot:5921250-Prymnesium_polylepis.2